MNNKKYGTWVSLDLQTWKSDTLLKTKKKKKNEPSSLSQHARLAIETTIRAIMICVYKYITRKIALNDTNSVGSLKTNHTTDEDTIQKVRFNHLISVTGEIEHHLTDLSSSYNGSHTVNNSHNNNTVHVYKYITEQDEENELDVMFDSTPEVLTKTTLMWYENYIH
uniref:Uncharacterized protein n=1 Tax=Magallana gigas TaxID=29159 RepID=A0A8W8P3X4_MAGGI